MTQPYHLLLIEDNPGDVKLIREALLQANFGTQLYAFSDGESALRFLRCEPPYQGAVRPDLILLDLSLPGKDGHAILAELKSSPEFLGIPILILTGSNEEHDVQKAYNHRANGYLVKPTDVDSFLKTVRGLDDFWRNVAQLPKRDVARKHGA